MVVKGHILGTLKLIDKLYRSSTDQDTTKLYCRIAVLETCGWIEQAMDDVVLRCAGRLTIKSGDRTFFQNKVVNSTYSFKYKNSFRPMLMRLIGLESIGILENNLDASKLSALKTELGNLKVSRDDAAHTHVKGSTARLDAPSITISRFGKVYEGLLDIDRTLRKLKL